MSGFIAAAAGRKAGEQFNEKCKKDADGNYYLSLNTPIKILAVIGFVIGILILGICIIFPDLYADEGIGMHLFVLATGIMVILMGFKLLRFKYTITDDALICRSFTTRCVLYTDIKDGAKLVPPKVKTAIKLKLADERNISIPMTYGFGCAHFAMLLGDKTGLPLFKMLTKEEADNRYQ